MILRIDVKNKDGRQWSGTHDEDTSKKWMINQIAIGAWGKKEDLQITLTYTGETLKEKIKHMFKGPETYTFPGMKEKLLNESSK